MPPRGSARNSGADDGKLAPAAPAGASYFPPTSYGREAEAAATPRALSSGPPVTIESDAPAAVDAALPRAASFGPPVALIGAALACEWNGPLLVSARTPSRTAA